jgi:glucokinase
MKKQIVIACDLGGTNLRMAAIDQDGNILYRTKRDTPKAERAEDILSALVESAEECREHVAELGETIAVAIAAPATVSAVKGVILKAPNVPALDGFRIIAALESELNLKAILENDANAAAVGENWHGGSQGYQNSICVTLGTGVGGGLIIDGKIQQGVDGTAGEIGHICVEPFGAPCGCGSRGCVEQYSSATAIVRQTKELASQYPKSELLQKNRLTSKDVYEAGLAGDELALEVFRRQGFYLGIALSSLINVLNPEVIVIGGGAAAGWDLFMPHLLEQVEHRTYREPRLRARFEKAVLGDDAGIMGAAKLAFDRLSVEKKAKFNSN